MIKYTRHAEAKLKEIEPFLLKITKGKILKVVSHPIFVYHKVGNQFLAIGKLDRGRSLCVVYNEENNDRKIVTFFPAKKGRYESKILS